MDWTQPPAWEPAQPPPVPSAPEPSTGSAPVLGGVRRTIATVVLAVGLLIVCGSAVVMAADPSASPAPNATTQPSNGTGGTTTPRTHTGNCPNMGTNGSGGSSAPSTTNPSSSPSSNT